MKINYLPEALSEVSNEHIEEATYVKRSDCKTHRKRYGIFAACLTLAFITLFLIVFNNNNKMEIITGYSVNNRSDNSYFSLPQPGQWFCYNDVIKAREDYAGKNVKFLLTFDIFPEQGKALTVETKYKEYERLARSGYQLFEVKYWDYSGDGQRENHAIVVGLFTGAQLDAFNSNPEYGYAFRFVYNGDHSNIKFNEQDAITLYPTNHSWFTNILSNFLLDYVNNSKLKRSSSLHL